jgi:hypothetical protein|tara:strand:+ start:95 stop:490 length:396 start_codon:yes stop_codon:yes gene_type:complete
MGVLKENMFNKIFKKYFSNQKSPNTEHDDIEISYNTKEFLDWMLHDLGKIHFKLKKNEIDFFIENYLDPWKENGFDDSFLKWRSKTPYLELNYFIEAIKGTHGFKIAQNAYDYLRLIYTPLAEFSDERGLV